METLDSFNRKLIDPIANRYFFVEDPVEIIIEKVPQLTKIAKIPIHPEFPERGHRELKVFVTKNKANIYVAKNDAQQFIEQELIRLKDLFNIKRDALNSHRKQILDFNIYNVLQHISLIIEDRYYN